MNTDEILSGNRLALARALTAVENESEDGRAVLSALYPRGGNGYLIGVTGSPGAGKSTLVNQIVLHLRQRFPAKKIAILAVDPTSPFSGGAVLGDRVRMRDLSGDPNVFIRSMASRGALGGLAAQTTALAQVFDGAGYDYIFIETVGAGQNEVDIVRLAHTTLVVEAPGMGDDIQAIKAGILEIADLLVINKADRPGVEATERALRGMLELANGSGRNTGHHRVEESAPEHTSEDQGDWQPPVLKTIASDRVGIVELVDAMLSHQAWMQTSGQMRLREAARVEAEMTALLQSILYRRWHEQNTDGEWASAMEAVLERKSSPQDAVDRLLRQ